MAYIVWCYISLIYTLLTYEQLCGKKLNSYISVAPYSFNAEECRVEDEDEFETSKGVRIVGLAFEPKNEEASYAAIIDGDGEITDYIKLEFLMHKRSEGFATERDKSYRYKDREKLKKYVTHLGLSNNAKFNCNLSISLPLF